MKMNEHIAVKLIATVVFFAGTSSKCGSGVASDTEVLEIVTPLFSSDIITNTEHKELQNKKKECRKYLQTDEAKKKLTFYEEQLSIAEEKKNEDAYEAVIKIEDEIFASDPRAVEYLDALNRLFEKSLLKLGEEVENAEKKFSYLSENQKTGIYRARIAPCIDLAFSILKSAPTEKLKRQQTYLVLSVFKAMGGLDSLQKKYNYTRESSTEVEDEAGEDE